MAMSEVRVARKPAGHHKIKRSQMGNDSLDNLVTLCAHCHMGEHGQLFYSVPAIRVCNKPKPRRR